MIGAKVSKNFKVSSEITDIRELIKLADEHKSVAYQAGMRHEWFVKPAAVIANWSLRMLSLRTFYKIEKI